MKLLATLAAFAATASAIPFKLSKMSVPPKFNTLDFHHQPHPQHQPHPHHQPPPPHGNHSASGKVVMSNTGHIYLADFDEHGVLTPTMKETVDGSPSWVAFVKPNLLYAVDELSTNMRLFHLDVNANTLELATSNDEGSSGVVHLAFTPDHKRMVAAAYGQGTVDIWNAEDEELKLIKTIVSDDPHGPNSARQTSAHPHESVLDPSGRFFVVNDLGTDTLLVIDSKDDAFDVINHVPVTPAGAGPRHGAFYPPGAEQATHYMVVCELMNIINVYALKYGRDSLDFTLVQTITSLGSNAPTNTTAAAGELIIPDKDNVYVSNRLTGNPTDNIAQFKVVPGKQKQHFPVIPGDPVPFHNGTAPTDFHLEWASLTSTGGKLPRMFSASKDGKDLLVGNQGGAMGAVVLRRDHDGSLDAKPVAKIDASYFGDKDGTGPMCISQVA